MKALLAALGSLALVTLVVLAALQPNLSQEDGQMPSSGDATERRTLLERFDQGDPVVHHRTEGRSLLAWRIDQDLLRSHPDSMLARVQAGGYVVLERDAASEGRTLTIDVGRKHDGTCSEPVLVFRVTGDRVGAAREPTTVTYLVEPPCMIAVTADAYGRMPTYDRP